jgi:hypothetical protein
VRYTVRLGLKPGGRIVDFTVVTSMGELKAAVLAATHQVHLEPSTSIFSVEILAVETDYTVDPERDLLDYWEVA